MFNKLLSKLKTSQTLNFSLAGQKFQISNLSFKFSTKNLRLPTLDYARLGQLVNARVLSLQSLRVGRSFSEILAILKQRGQNTLKYANKKTFTRVSLSYLALYFAYEYYPGQTKIGLSYDKNEFNEKLVSSLSHLYNMHFYPSFICTTPLLQSIMQKSPAEAVVRYIREPVLLKDGGQIVLDWALPVKKVEYSGTYLHGKYYSYQPSQDNKIMFILHGLTGGSETNYIQTLVEAARRKGYRVVAMNQRGVNQPLSTPIPFHGGTLDDLHAGLTHVRNKYPDAPIMVIGTSFGANQLMRYLGQEGSKVNIAGGVMLATPFDIDDCVDQIQDTVYEKFFMRNYFERNFLPNLAMFEPLKDSHGINIEDILKAKSLRDYHSHFTVKIFDHKDVREYFQLTKIQHSHIKNIKVPLLLLHAKDDPIAVQKSVPIENLRENPNIIYAETNRGAHLAWFSGLKPKRWYSKPTLEFLDKVLELKQETKKL